MSARSLSIQRLAHPLHPEGRLHDGDVGRLEGGVQRDVHVVDEARLVSTVLHRHKEHPAVLIGVAPAPPLGVQGAGSANEHSRNTLAGT